MANRDVRTSQSSVNNRRQNTHILYKRQPRKFEQGENVLYVNTKTNTKAHLSICNKLIKERNEHEIIIYCLGAAIQRGILLALQICEQHVSFVIETATFSTELLGKIDERECAIFLIVGL